VRDDISDADDFPPWDIRMGVFEVIADFLGVFADLNDRKGTGAIYL